MGDTLFGGVESGTPLETRGGTEALASMYQNMLQGGDASGFNNMLQMFQGGSQGMGQSFENLFGISQGAAGVPQAVQSLLASPADRTRGLFASMRPFENRQMNEAVSGTRGMFGTAGARFSRNLGTAEAQTRGEMANQFGRARQEGLLTAQAQQGDFLAQLMQLANQSQQTGLQGLDAMSRFLAPGAPVYREGMLPGLLAAGGNLAMALTGNPMGAAGLGGQLAGLLGGGGPSAPSTLPPPNSPWAPGGSHFGMPMY